MFGLKKIYMKAPLIFLVEIFNFKIILNFFRDHCIIFHNCVETLEFSLDVLFKIIFFLRFREILFYIFDRMILEIFK